MPVTLQGTDAYSLWAGGESPRPVIVLLAGVPGDRQRFSTAHELAHLVMHQSFSDSLAEIERQANEFAGELLLPRQAMEQELVPPVTLNSLAGMKVKWGASIQALIRRALDLCIITQRKYRYLHEQLGARGWRRAEPASIAVPIEKPRALRKMAELLYGSPVDYKRLAVDVNLSASFVQEIVEAHADKSELPASRPAPRTAGQVVPFKRPPRS
jgi:Zn-dependent peptidase ImmA (M78 family)